jgi:hypothetical protein
MVAVVTGPVRVVRFRRFRVTQTRKPLLRRSGRASATRDLMLAAAERLFAEHGMAAVSNRQVGEAQIVWSRGTWPWPAPVRHKPACVLNSHVDCRCFVSFRKALVLLP